MLPNIRAVIAAVAAAIGLLIIASGVVATLRVAQESRAGSLHADLAQRGHATAPEPRPVVVVETPGPTLLAKAREIAALSPATEQVPAPIEPLAMEREQPPQAVATIVESPPLVPLPAEPDPDVAAASLAMMESAPDASAESPPEPPAASVVVAAVPDIVAAQPESLSPPPLMAMGGPSPEEIAQAKAQRKAAERARAKKAAEEKRKKARAIRIARERKLAAQRAADAQKQQARAPSQPGGFGFPPAGSFNSAPFGNTNSFGGAANRR